MKITIKNQDYECYLKYAKEQAEHQEDWLRTGYTSKGFYLKDFCHIKAKGEWHLYHIAGTPEVCCCLPGNEIWFGHASTKDFCKWTTHLPCFYIDPSGWDNGHVFAPYVLKHGGKYWMFYTGVDIENTQRIGVAVSRDLFDWKRVFNRPVICPEKYGWAFCPTKHGSACRDPHVTKIGEKFYMYYTAVTKEGRACIGLASSKDLLKWQDKGIAYTAPGYAHCESSNMQKLGDKYLLFFGGHYEYWSYVVSDNPYSWPKQEPVSLIKGVTAMEVVEKKGKRWLVSYFGLNNYRLFLAVIDWSGKKPAVTEVKEKKQLKEFGI